MRSSLRICDVIGGKRWGGLCGDEIAHCALKGFWPSGWLAVLDEVLSGDVDDLVVGQQNAPTRHDQVGIGCQPVFRDCSAPVETEGVKDAGDKIIRSGVIDAATRPHSAAAYFF